MLGKDYTKEELAKNTQPLYMNMRESGLPFFHSASLRQSTMKLPSQRIITLDDFDIIKVLGRGTFGKVMMV